MIPPLGILGDGQLAQMLVEAARPMNIQIFVLSNQKKSPASKAGAKTVSTPKELFEKSPLILFENEFVNVQNLKKDAKNLKVQFFPSLEVIETLQQKISQKNLLKKLDVPTSDWIVWKKEPIPEWLLSVVQKLKIPFVLKWSYLGYDGKGVRIIQTEKDLENIEEFFKQGEKNGSEIYAEVFVPFRQELAMVTTYLEKQPFVHYPLVISVQEDGICSRVHGPAVDFKVSPELEQAAQEYSKRVAVGSSLQGTFALEFFETDDGRLLVNEIAPRVHNTGHYTQDACEVSQFENHLRAALNLPLGAPNCKGIFAMFNLLGPEGVHKETDATNFLPKTENRPYALKSHWYGKSIIEPRRKLGHLNGSVQQTKDFQSLQKEMKKWHQEWLENIKKL